MYLLSCEPIPALTERKFVLFFATQTVCLHHVLCNWTTTILDIFRPISEVSSFRGFACGGGLLVSIVLAANWLFLSERPKSAGTWATMLLNYQCSCDLGRNPLWLYDSIWSSTVSHFKVTPLFAICGVVTLVAYKYGAYCSNHPVVWNRGVNYIRFIALQVRLSGKLRKSG